MQPSLISHPRRAHRAGGPVKAFVLAAAVAAMTAMPGPARAQPAAPAPCSTANAQQIDDLLRALTDARRKRSSLTFQLRLTPIEFQLKSLKAAQLNDTSGAECQRIASQTDTERGRLVRAVPELADQLTAAAAAPAAGQAMRQPVPQPATPPMPPSWVPTNPSSQPAAHADASCGADNHRSRSDLAQRFVLFMQLARVPAEGLLPYQSFSQRLTSLDGNMAARPENCSEHSAALMQSNSEFQQLMALEARTIAASPASMPPPGTAAAQLAGTMPLPATEQAAGCVAELRLGFRDLQQLATSALLALPEGERRAQAQQLINQGVKQQIDLFGRGPMSIEVCGQAHQGLNEMRASAAGLRTAYAAPVASPAAAPQAQRAAAAPPPPQQQQAVAQEQPDVRQEYLECMAGNRRTFNELDREARNLLTSGKVSAADWGGIERDLAMDKNLLNQVFIPIQCAQLSQQLNLHLSIVRDIASRPAQAQAPVRAQAPAQPQAQAQVQPQALGQRPLQGQAPVQAQPTSQSLPQDQAPARPVAPLPPGRLVLQTPGAPAAAAPAAAFAPAIQLAPARAQAQAAAHPAPVPQTAQAPVQVKPPAPAPAPTVAAAPRPAPPPANADKCKPDAKATPADRKAGVACK